MAYTGAPGATSPPPSFLFSLSFFLSFFLFSLSFLLFPFLFSFSLSFFPFLFPFRHTEKKPGTGAIRFVRRNTGQSVDGAGQSVDGAVKCRRSCKVSTGGREREAFCPSSGLDPGACGPQSSSHEAGILEPIKDAVCVEILLCSVAPMIRMGVSAFTL
jgi:hypothetical protein